MVIRLLARLDVAHLRLAIQLVQRLLHNLDALTHLHHPHAIAVIHIAAIQHWHIKIEAVVVAIRVHPPQVIRHTRCAQTRPGERIRNAALGAHVTHANCAALDNFVVVDQRL